MEVVKINKMKILHFEITNTIGGIESLLINVYRNIDRNKYEFGFVTQFDNPAFESEINLLGGKIYKIHSYKQPFLYCQDVLKLIGMKYDLIHIHKNSAINILPYVLSYSKYKGKIVSHAHNTAPSNGQYIINKLHYINRFLLNYLSTYKFACSKLAGVWLYGKKVNFDIVKNGIDTEKYIFDLEARKKIREALLIPQDACVIGHIGRFTKQKNHKKLLEIFKDLIEVKSNIYLLLVGDGELKNEIMKYVEDNKYEHIFFLGERNDVPKLMSAMDIFIMPSLYEGLPIAAIEAQASGLKLYVSDTISREVQLTDDVKWFSINSDNNTIIKQLIKDTVSIGSVEDRINKNNVIRLSDFSIISTISHVEKIYNKLILN